MFLHEYQAKELLSRFAVPIPQGRIVDSAGDAGRIASRLGLSRFVVKAQVHATDRLQGGGVRFSMSPDGVAHTVETLMASPFTKPGGPALGERVRWVLIEEAVEARQLLYVAMHLDRMRGGLVALASAAGGAAIERRAVSDPDLVQQIPLEIREGRATGDFAALATAIGLDGGEAAALVDLFEKLGSMLVSIDATQIELNPVAVSWDGALVALDAKVEVDNHALFRHPGLAALRAAVEVEEGDPVLLGADRHHINYQRMDGDIGIVANGAGLALATLDQVVDAGGAPANFMDVRTTASSLDVAYGLELIMANDRVRAILVNVHGGGMQSCDTIAEGVGVAMRRSPRPLPLVIRMVGNNAEYAWRVLRNQGVAFTAADEISEAALQACRLARGSS